MLDFIKNLFKPSPATVLRRRTAQARLERANESWVKYGAPFDKALEDAVANGRFYIGLRWGEEDYFIPGSLGAKWAKSKGLTLSDPGWGSFWSLRW